MAEFMFLLVVKSRTPSYPWFKNLLIIYIESVNVHLSNWNIILLLLLVCTMSKIMLQHVTRTTTNLFWPVHLLQFGETMLEEEDHISVLPEKQQNTEWILATIAYGNISREFRFN